MTTTRSERVGAIFLSVFWALAGLTPLACLWKQQADPSTIFSVALAQSLFTALTFRIGVWSNFSK